jgi:N-acyl-D-aspartate/D-glutamate deacylase
MAKRSGRPISVSIAQVPRRPDEWRVELDRFAEATAAGVTMRGQVGARAVGIMLGLETSLNPFMYSPAYEDIASLPLPERVAMMRRPEIRQAIVDGARVDENGKLGSRVIAWYPHMFRLGDPPNYEPDPADSATATAGREGRVPAEVAYDWLLECDGNALLYVPSLNWANGNLDCVREMLLHPAAVPGLSDGGAHVGTICDVSFPTTLLQWWGRDRPHGRIPVEMLIAKQCRMTAEAVGLYDRGVLRPGGRADINVIDFDNLRLHVPDIVHDLPAGGRRMLQRATGYRHTFVAGTEIRSDGESTGATPGRLVRGPKQSRS